MLLARIFTGYHVLYNGLNRIQYRLVMTGGQYAVDLCVKQVMSTKRHLIEKFERWIFFCFFSDISYRYIKLNFYNIIREKWNETYTTGKTFGKTIVASARYSYKIRVSFSLVEYFTKVANMVRTRVCVEKSVNTSGSSKTLFSLLRLTLVLRSFCIAGQVRLH